MIICDDKKFVFVHIPKCAGTTVRLSLEKYDTTNGKFAHSNGFIEGVGRIDMGHIPLDRLRELFPKEYEKVQNYRCFAVIRDPYKRFPSSLYQHLLMYSDRPVKAMKRRDFVNSVDNAISYLSKGDLHLSHDYIHFQRQRDYIYNGENQLVDNLYTTSALENMYTRLSEITGEHIGHHKQAGEGLIYKGTVTGAIASSLGNFYTPAIKDILPENFIRKLKALLMEKPASAFEDIFSSNEVKSFIRDYYSEDITIYKEVHQSSNNKNG